MKRAVLSRRYVLFLHVSRLYPELARGNYRPVDGVVVKEKSKCYIGFVISSDRFDLRRHFRWEAVATQPA
jgi:hypothetical protein